MFIISNKPSKNRQAGLTQCLSLAATPSNAPIFVVYRTIGGRIRKLRCIQAQGLTTDGVINIGGRYYGNSCAAWGGVLMVIMSIGYSVNVY